ncbi:MAG: putative sugar O-methyltransferase [Candidatus Omnitrophica bacterium]|nr:putative sugar O-methyltransferase [Candidatus Omnitrophota bacterium]
MTYNAILDTLYEVYYDGGAASAVMSSHWKKHAGTSSVMKKTGGGYTASGAGFGVFLVRSPLVYLKHSPEILLSGSLLKQYTPDKRAEEAGRAVAGAEGRIVEFDCVKQILTVDLLLKQGLLDRAGLITVIGDGFGYMTSLVKALCPQATIVSVNLGRVLFFDALYTQKVFPDAKAVLVKDRRDIEDFRSYSFVFLEAEKYHLLSSLPVNLFINIASMQEMDMGVIRTYFDLMRSSTVESYFYSCNRVEKTLPDGSVIRFNDFPWQDNDRVLVDGLCPWYQRFPSSCPPFWRSFDGPLWHRLAGLGKKKQPEGVRAGQ